MLEDNNFRKVFLFHKNSALDVKHPRGMRHWRGFQFLKSSESSAVRLTSLHDYIGKWKIFFQIYIFIQTLLIYPYHKRNQITQNFLIRISPGPKLYIPKLFIDKIFCEANTVPTTRKAHAEWRQAREPSKPSRKLHLRSVTCASSAVSLVSATRVQTLLRFSLAKSVRLEKPIRGLLFCIDLLKDIPENIQHTLVLQGLKKR